MACKRLEPSHHAQIFQLEEIVETRIPYDLLASSILCEWSDRILIIPRNIQSPDSLRASLISSSITEDGASMVDVTVLLPDSMDYRFRVEACAFANDRLFLLIGMKLFVFRPTTSGARIVIRCDTVLQFTTKYTSLYRDRGYVILTAETFRKQDTSETIRIAKVKIDPLNLEWERYTLPIDGYPLLLFQPRHVAATLSGRIIVADIDRYRLRSYDSNMRLVSESVLAIQDWTSHGDDIRHALQQGRSAAVKTLIDTLRQFAYSTWSVRRIDALNDSLLLVTLQTPNRIGSGIMTGKPEFRYDLWVWREDSLVLVGFDFRTPSPSEDDVVELSRQWPPGDAFTVLSKRIVLVEPCVAKSMVGQTYGEMIRSVKSRLADDSDPNAALVLISPLHQRMNR